MSKAPPRRRTSGFCNPTLPRTAAYDPHQRCPGCHCRAAGCPCNPEDPMTNTTQEFGWTPLCEQDPDRDGWCAYHRSACTPDGPGEAPDLSPEEAATVARFDAAPDALTEPAGPDSPEDAVAWARSAADAVDKALLGYDPEDWEDAVRLLYSLRRVIETLRTADASLVRWLYLHGEHGIHLHVEGVPGDVGITRGRAKERWAAPEAVNAYVDRQMEAIGGELPDPRQVVEWVLEVLPATQSTALRKKPLREAGLDLEDFYASEPGSLQVNLPRAPR